MAARAPALVAMTLRMVLERFKKGDFTSPCWSPQRTTSEAFRTDAKCEHGRIVLGGWELVYTSSTKQARWFALEVTPEMAPWLFYKGLDVQRMSTTAELLATYAALHAFGFFTRRQGPSTGKVISNGCRGYGQSCKRTTFTKTADNQIAVGRIVVTVPYQTLGQRTVDGPSLATKRGERGS